MGSGLSAMVDAGIDKLRSFHKECFIGRLPREGGAINKVCTADGVSNASGRRTVRSKRLHTRVMPYLNANPAALSGDGKFCFHLPI